MTEKTFSNKYIWELTLPIILGSIAQNLINITDTAFLGRVNEVTLGAGLLGGMFYFIFAMLAFGFGTGSQIIVARREGEKRIHHIASVIHLSMIFVISLAIITFISIEFFAIDILKNFIESKEVYNETNIYINYRFYGIFFMFINIIYRAFLVGISNTKIIIYNTIIIASVNIYFDYALIFGNFGFEKMGIKGAAIASVLAEISGTINFIMYTAWNKKIKKYNLYKKTILKFSDFNKLIKISFPVMIQNFMSLGGWFVFFIMIEKMGERDLAISNIIRSIYVVILIPVFAFSSSTNTLISNLLGQNKISSIKSTVIQLIRLCLFISIPVSVIGYLFGEYFVEVYTNNNSLIIETTRVFKQIVWVLPIMSVAFVLFSTVSGSGKTNISLVIEAIVISSYLYITYLLVNIYKVDIQTVWLNEYYYASMLLFASLIYLKFGNWKQTKL